MTPDVPTPQHSRAPYWLIAHVWPPPTAMAVAVCFTQFVPERTVPTRHVIPPLDPPLDPPLAPPLDPPLLVLVVDPLLLADPLLLPVPPELDDALDVLDAS